MVKPLINVPRHFKKTSAKQRGGGFGSSAYSGLFYAPSVHDVQALSKYTLEYINKSPMFHPLEFGTVIPTMTSGITPTGAFYWNIRDESSAAGSAAPARTC